MEMKTSALLLMKVFWRMYFSVGVRVPGYSPPRGKVIFVKDCCFKDCMALEQTKGTNCD